LPGPTHASSLLPVEGVAELLGIPPQIVFGWIENDSVPYLELSDPADFRVPMHALLSTLRQQPALACALTPDRDATPDAKRAGCRGWSFREGAWALRFREIREIS
jgi:hypothetical protein